MDTFKYVSGKKYRLAGSGCTSTATSITLQSFKLPDDSTTIAQTDFGTTGYGTLEPKTSNVELISFTGVTQNADGTATLTGVTRGLKFNADYTSSSALKKAHAGGAVFIISNTPQFYDELSGKDNDETVTGVWTFTESNMPRISAQHNYGSGEEEYLATKRYADSLAIAGASDASTTQKGIVEEATDSELQAGTPAGGTSARLFAGGASHTQTPTANKVPVANSSGKLAAGWGGSASTLATLNSSSLVVENPANATATPTSSKIPISSGSTVLDVGWIDTGTTANKIVKLNGSAQIPAVDGSLITNIAAASWKTLTETRLGDTASGSQVIPHGLGRIPKIVIISASVGDTGAASFGSSEGSYDGTTNACRYLAKLSSDSNFQSGVTAAIIDLKMFSDSAKQVATATVDTTNITLAWTRTGSSDSDTIHMLIRVQ